MEVASLQRGSGDDATVTWVTTTSTSATRKENIASEAAEVLMAWILLRRYACFKVQAGFCYVRSGAGSRTYSGG